MAMMDKISAAGLREYGLYPEDYAQKLAAHKGAEAVVAALNNADVDGVALQLLEKHTDKVLRGMEIAAELVGTSKKILHIPAYAGALADKLAGKGVEIAEGIVDVRKSEKCLVTHIVTMYELAAIEDGTYTDGVWACANGGEFKKVCPCTIVSELVGENVKGVKLGYTVAGPEALSLKIGDVNVENGVVKALTTSDCVVSEVQKTLLASRAQSCGKCVFCREGLLQLEAMQKDMTVGKGTLGELDMTKEIGSAMCFSTPCSMGQNSARIALTAIDAFRGEYEEHIKKHKCSADVCLAFRKYYVDPKACVGCTKCMAACPVDAIDGAEGYIHIVFDNGCTKCGECVGACPAGAIHKTLDRVPKLPPKMMRVGRFHG